MQHVRTKWHHILPLIEEDQVYMSAAKDGKARSYKDFGMKREALIKFVKDVDALPRFVVDRELMDIAAKGEYTQSLIDMKRAGVLHLPYREMVVEFNGKRKDNKQVQSIVLLRDVTADGPKAKWEEVLPDKEQEQFDFYGLRMSVETDNDGEYLCVSPSVLFMSINGKDVVTTEKAAEWTDYSDETCWLRMLAHGHGLLPANRLTNELVEQTWTKDSGVVYYAAVAAYLLMSTGGIAKEYIDCEKLNKKRGPGTGKSKIPAHTYIRIGHVYRSASSSESEEYVARRSPRPHWRRGHIRGVHYGKGRQFLRSKYIPPKLVAYHGDDTPIPPIGKEYVVIK